MLAIGVAIVVIVILIFIMNPRWGIKEALTDAYRAALVGLTPSPTGYATFKSRIGVTSFSPLGFTQMATANKKGTLTDALINNVIDM